MHLKNRVCTACLILAWVLFLPGCQRSETSAPQTALAVATPDLTDRQPAVVEAVNRGFEALRAAAEKDDAKTLAESYGKTGMLLHANAFPEQAEICYREAMQLDPQFFDWPYLLGYLASESENWAEAASWFEKALGIETRYSGAHMRLGRTYLQLGKFAEAEQEFRWILRVNPQSGAARFGLGRIAAEQGDFATAVSHFEAVIQRMPQATAVYYPLAMAYRRLGDREKAKAMLALRGKEDTPFFDPIVVALEEMNATVEEAMRRGLAAMDANQLDRAEALLNRAVNLAPEDAVAQLNLGFLRLKKQQLDLAEKQFGEALRLKPDLAEAQTNLGVVFALRGQDEQALSAFEKVMQSHPDFEGARVLAGNALMRLDRFEDALAIHQQLMTQKPQDSRAFFYYGLTLVQLNREADALSHFETSTTRFPRQAELVEALARLLACAKSPDVRDGARALNLAKGLFQARQTPEHARTLAMAFAEVGQFDEAAGLMDQVLLRVDAARFPQLAKDLSAQRDLYRGNRPCRQPWIRYDPALKPGPP